MKVTPEMQAYLDSVTAGERAAYDADRAEKRFDALADARAREARKTFRLIRGGRYEEGR